MFTLVPTCSHLFLLVLTCSDLFSLVLTCSHLLSLVLTCSHLFSLVLTWSHLVSLRLSGIHMDSPGPSKEKGKHPKVKGKREGGDLEFDLIPTRHPDRAHAQMHARHEPISRLDSPPTSDLMAWRRQAIRYPGAPIRYPRKPIR